MGRDQQDCASRTFQILAAVIANIGALGLGNALAWSSPALSNISDCGSDCDPDIGDIGKEAGSWVVGLMSIGAALSGPVTGFAMDKIGRKRTMIIMAAPSIIGWICLMMPKYISGATVLFYVGRLLTGFGAGASSLACPRYTAEICDIDLRGSLGSMVQLMISVGIAWTNALNINNAVRWDVITGLGIIFPAIMAFGMMFMPESPYYFITKDDESAARVALGKFRGPTHNIEKELEEMKQQYVEHCTIGSVSLMDLLTKGVYLKPFLIMMVVMVLLQFTGIGAVTAYLANIFIDAGSEMDAGLSATIATLVQVVTTVLAMVLVDRFGRRILLIVSDAFMAVSIITLGVYFYLKENVKCAEGGQVSLADCKPDGGFDPELIQSLGWLPLVSLIVYLIAFSIGFGPLPFAINAEMFPREAQNLGSSIALSMNWFCSFLVAKFQPNIENAIHTSGSYFFYGCICAVGTVFVIFCLPETKGKTPDEMKAHFARKSKS